MCNSREVKLIFSRNLVARVRILRAWMNSKTQSRIAAEVRMTLLTRWNSIPISELSWRSVINYNFARPLYLFQIDPAEAQHHEVEIESDRYENHYVLPVERRRTINGGDRRGAALVFAYFTIESVDEQPGIRRTLWEKGVRLHLRIQEATALQLRHWKAMDRQ